MKAKARSILARRHSRFIGPYEQRFAKDYRSVMREMRDDLGALTPGRVLGEGLRGRWRRRAVEAMRPAYHAAIVGGGREFLTKTLSIRKSLATLQTKAAKKRAADLVVNLEEQFADRLAETVDTTFEALQDILTEAAQDKLDLDEIEDLVEQEWSDVLGRRTDNIALTETNGSVNSVRDYLMREVVELQDWINAADERVRPTHLIYGRAGSKPVGFDWAQLIPDAGYTLRYPCDPECHEPGEVINCRCFVAPAGEVDMDPAELRDWLEDFEMEPEDVMLSEEQTPEYMVNPYLGKGVVKGDLPGHEFRGNQWTTGQGDAKAARYVEVRNEPTDPNDKAAFTILHEEIRRQLDAPSLPQSLRDFLDERGLVIKYKPVPTVMVTGDGRIAELGGQIEYDPRYADAPVFTVTPSTLEGETGIVGHEIGHLMNHATLWAEAKSFQPGESRPTSLEDEGHESRLEMRRAFEFEGGVTDYAHGFIGPEHREHRMTTGLTIGPGEQFAEVEGMFQHSIKVAERLWVGAKEPELEFALALARGAASRVGADTYPGFAFYGRRFPKTARAWLRLRGVNPSTLAKFDKALAPPTTLLGSLKKAAKVIVLKEWDEAEHPRAPAGSPEGGQFTSEGGAGGGGEAKPTMTEVGRALIGAPQGFNVDPSAFQPLVFGKTQVGEKREAAVTSEMEKFEKGMTLKGGGKDDIKIPKTTPQEMSDKMEALFAQATDEQLKQAGWYKDAAGATVEDLHAEFEQKIPGLGKEVVAGILAACSANMPWDDNYGTESELGGSNQKTAERILKAWTANEPVTIKPEHIALATAFCGSLEEGEYKGLKMPEPGTYSFQDLAKADPRLGYLFYTSWEGAARDEKGKLLKVEREFGGSMGFGGMPGHVIPSLMMLRGDKAEEAFGKESKVRSFYSNIIRSMAGIKDENATIDIWMARAMLDKPGEDGPITGAHYKSFVGPAARYEGLRRLIEANATKHGMEPKQYQAIVWYVIRTQYEQRKKERTISAAHERALIDYAKREQRAAARAAKAAARELAKKAKRKQGELFKGFTISEPEAPPADNEIMFAWLQRFLAHERGLDVEDSYFGPWDEDDEAAASEWKDAVTGVRVHRGVLTFVLKGDFEGHPFRGNQWTSGYYVAEGDVEGATLQGVGELDDLYEQLGKQERLVAMAEKTGMDEDDIQSRKDKAEAIRAQLAEAKTRLGTEGAEYDTARAELKDVTNKLAEARDEAERASQADLPAADAKVAALKAQQDELNNRVDAAERALTEKIMARTAEIDPRSVLPEDRRQIANDVAKSIRDSWPDDKTFTSLKAKEDNMGDRAREIAKPALEEKKKVDAELEKVKDEFEAADKAVGDFRNKMHDESYKATVEKFLELHPEADPRTEENKARLAALDDASLVEQERLVAMAKDADNLVRAGERLRDKVEESLAREAIAKYPDLEPKVGESFSPERLIQVGFQRDHPELGPGSQEVADGVDALWANRRSELEATDTEYQALKEKASESKRAYNEAQLANSEAIQSTRALAEMAGSMNPDGTLVYGAAAHIARHDQQAAEAGQAVIARVEDSDEYRALKGKAEKIREQIGDLEAKSNELGSTVAGAEQQARNEFAQEAGPGYYARRAMEDDDYYEKEMDKLRGAWISVGGEPPMRVRVATGIGLGLQAGAIYDTDLHRFLRTDDYGDLRDDEETIKWAGLIQREYLETQEDIASGKLTEVEHLGERHMGVEPVSGQKAGKDSPEETMSDNEKYDFEKAHQDFWESDTASEKEFEAQQEEWSGFNAQEKIGLATGDDKVSNELVDAHAGKLIAKEAGIDTDDDAALDTHLRTELGDSFKETDPKKLEGDARAQLTDEMLRGETGRNYVAALRERVDEIVAKATETSGSPISKEKVLAALDTLEEQAPRRDTGYSNDQLLSVFRSPGAFGWSDGAAVARAIHVPTGAEANGIADQPDFLEAIQLTTEQRNRVESELSGETGQAEIASLAETMSENNRTSNLAEYAVSSESNEDIWERVKDEDIGDVLGSRAPKYASGTMEQYSQEKHRDNFQWEGGQEAFDEWWENEGKQDTSYWTEEYQSAMADWESGEGEYAEPEPEEEKEPEEKDEEHEERKKPAQERGYVTVFRGFHGKERGYVPNFVESWSTSKKLAGSFGDTVVERKVALEKILVFQGARNWRTAGKGEMGSREFEVMVMSDLPKWYREALRNYRKRQAEAKKREAKQ